MNTPCPHCSARIRIDPATHATLAGHSHFTCPACQGAVPVPVAGRPRLQLNPAPGTQAGAPAPPRPRHQSVPPRPRKTNRTLLILGSTALLLLGGIAFVLASMKSGDTHASTQNIRNEIINNSYFQNLIATGVTTEKDLDSVIDIRSFGSGFIGLSKAQVSWEQAQRLATQTGAEVLAVQDGAAATKNELISWVVETFGSQLPSSAWVCDHAEVRVLDGPDVLAVSTMDRPRKVLLQWGLPITEEEYRGAEASPTVEIPGLVLHLSFDDGSQVMTSKDSSGSNNHGKPSGVRWTPKGRRGGAYEFSGNGDVIVIPNHPSINPGQLTLAAWIKTSNDDGRWHRIFDKCFDQGFALSIGGQIQGTDRRGLIHFETSPTLNKDGFGGNITNTVVSDGQWHHVVATFDGTEQQIFVDGRFDGPPYHLKQSTPIPTNSFDLAIGCPRSNSPASEAGESFRGVIDEPMMWNRALSPEEVLLLYKSFQ